MQQSCQTHTEHCVSRHGLRVSKAHAAPCARYGIDGQSACHVGTASYPGIIRRPTVGRQSARSPTRRRDLAELAAAHIFDAGDVERHPGPARRRVTSQGRLRPALDLFVGDVTQVTASRYHFAMNQFEEWLGYRGLTLHGLAAGGLQTVTVQVTGGG